MKKIVLLFITFLFSISLYAQTEIEIQGWFYRGLDASEQGNSQDAIKWLEMCKEGYEKLNKQEDEKYGRTLVLLGNSYNDLGIEYYNLGDYDKAVEMGTKAMEIYRETLGEKHPDYATSLGNLAEYYSHLSDYAKAVETGTKALEIRREMLGEKHPDYALSLNNLANYYYYLGDYAKAMELGTLAMEIRREMFGEKHPDYATSRINLANYYDYLGNYDKAVEMGTQAMEILREALGEKHPDYAISLNNLAGYYSHLGDYAKAVEMGTKAVEIQKEVLGMKHPDYATSLISLANYYYSLGNYDKAVEMGTLAMEILREALGEKHPNYAMSLNNLALYYSDFGDYDKAAEMGTLAMEILREALGEKHPDYALSLNNFALYYSNLGDYAKAVEMGTKAMEIQREVLGEKHPDYATSLGNLASYYSHLGDYAKAVEMETKAMEIQREVLGEKHPDYATSLGNLANYYYYLGDYTKMFKYYNENISIKQSNTLQQFTGLTSTQRSMFWAKDSYDFTDIYPSFTYQSQATTVPDLYDKSALFTKGLLLSTEIEMNRLIQESGDEEALRMFEKLQMNRMQLQKSYETPIAERHTNTDSLAQAVDRQEQALVKRSKVYGDFTRKLRTTWQDVQGALKSDEIAVEFLSFNVWGSDSTMVAALTLRKDDTEPKFIPLFEQQQLQSVSDQQYYHCPEVTALVWQPLQQELKGIKRIFFSPAGALHNIGIEYAAGMENYEMYRLSTTREIIALSESRAEIHPAPPQGRVRETSPNPSQGGERVTASLFGGVDYNASISGTPPLEGTGEASVSIALHRSLIDSLDVRGMTANYLPQTLTEVQEIKASFDIKKQIATLTTGKEATETSVKSLSSHSPRIIHIATHGFYLTEDRADYARSQDKLRFLGHDDQRSAADLEDKALTRSGLLMAGANETLHGEDRPLDVDDGVLTAQEISRLDLRGLDLVVLSACKTGNGDINQGEGVFGLQRGFKKAGAQTIVMSLWEVNDEATQILMTAFYENLLQGQSKRDAFQNAQHHLRTVDNGQFDKPQFWAAFILLD
ncbi:MAG: CHAT domain-containing protein [Prevotella sp.]|nr:CHAT domain-containing protein [Prevotella sp.]